MRSEKVKILVLGEGPTDFGLTADDHSLKLEGPVPVLVRHLLEREIDGIAIEFLAVPLKNIRQTREGARRIGSSSRGFAGKLRVCMGLAVGREAKAIVAVSDRDGKENSDRIEGLNEGREYVARSRKPCAVGVAIETIEAWLLADEQALREGLENPAISRQKDPESLTSRDETSANSPKGCLNQLIDESQEGAASSDYPELYAAIARAIDLDVLIKRCPEGFVPFAAQVKEMAPQLEIEDD